jgi:hypothetical protein
MCLPIQALVRHHTHIISSRPTIDISTELSLLRNYYRHLENFPCHNELAPDAVNFLRKTLTYASAGQYHLYSKTISCINHIFLDHMTARESATTPWNAEDCKAFIELLDGFDSIRPSSDDVNEATSEANDYKGGGTTFDDDGYKTWFVARLICIIRQPHSKLHTCELSHFPSFQFTVAPYTASGCTMRLRIALLL